MDFSMEDPFDFDAFINWPDDPSAAHAGAEDGRELRISHHTIPLGSASLGYAQSPSSAEWIPDYSADSANEDTHMVTAAPMPSHGDADTSNSDQELSSPITTKKCACIVCLKIGVNNWNLRVDSTCHFKCGLSHQAIRISSIDQAIRIGERESVDRAAHEKTHYRQDLEDRKSPFCCPVEHCRFSSKRWSDLIRHTNARHCKIPSKFECSEIGCKYHGEGNGFTREDKLTEHCRKMHQGQKVPSQAARAIMPAPAAFEANAQGSSSTAAYGA